MDKKEKKICKKCYVNLDIKKQKNYFHFNVIFYFERITIFFNLNVTEIRKNSFWLQNPCHIFLFFLNFWKIKNILYTSRLFYCILKNSTQTIKKKKNQKEETRIFYNKIENILCKKNIKGFLTKS